MFEQACDAINNFRDKRPRLQGWVIVSTCGLRQPHVAQNLQYTDVEHRFLETHTSNLSPLYLFIYASNRSQV